MGYRRAFTPNKLSNSISRQHANKKSRPVQGWLVTFIPRNLICNSGENLVEPFARFTSCCGLLLCSPFAGGYVATAHSVASAPDACYVTSW
jgi:hypothetical protein